MILKRVIQLALVPALVLGFSSSLFAFGIGLYGDFHGGKTWGPGENIHYAGGGGLVWDTNLAYNRVFNYRMELGVNYVSIGSIGDSIGVSWVHYFGFGIVRTKMVRLWIGPQFTVIGLASGVTGAIGGMGFAMGLNLNFGNVFTLFFTGSGRFIGGIADGNGVYGADGMINMGIMFRVAKDVYSSSRY